MWQRGVGVEARIVYGIDGIDSIGEYLFFHTVEVATDHQCFEFTIQLIGQRATFCEQFEAHIGDDAVFYFAIYNQIVHNR